jgi:hypothetical protein
LDQGQTSRPESTDTFEEDLRTNERRDPVTIAMATQTMMQTMQAVGAQTPPSPTTTTATLQDTYNKLLTVFNRRIPGGGPPGGSGGGGRGGGGGGPPPVPGGGLLGPQAPQNPVAAPHDLKPSGNAPQIFDGD